MDFREFDLLGIIKINDNSGIEELVTPSSDGQYLSRSSLYFQERNFNEQRLLREKLKRKLVGCVDTKKAFIIFEYMLNCSAKVFYSCIEEKLVGENENYIMAKRCFEEDVKNIINLLNNEMFAKPQFELPAGETNTPSRCIELDNKALLYLFTKSVNINPDIPIIVPGFGGILIGPFFKMLKGNQYANVFYSEYKDLGKASELEKSDIFNFVTEPEIIDDYVIILDDNIGTGKTMLTLKNKFKEKNIEVRYGAVQFNWINYYKVENGEKDIDRFDPSDVDYLTQINYPGHKLLEHAYEYICGIRKLENETEELSPGDRYCIYKKNKSYDFDRSCDILTLSKKGEKFARESGIDLMWEINPLNFNFTLKNSAIDLIKSIQDYEDKYLSLDDFRE